MLGALPALPAWYIFAAIGALCGGMAAYAVRSLWDGLPKSLRAPCSFYAFDITLMACCAFLFALAMPRAVAWLAPLGGVLFVASDTTLSVDAFKRPVPHRYLIVMGTYIAAQTMLTAAFALD
jgi:uncharacterized membrane protein YhhN